LHTAQLMPLPLTVSCFSKIQIGFTFLVPAHLGSPGKGAVKRVCVCNITQMISDKVSVVETNFFDALSGDVFSVQFLRRCRLVQLILMKDQRLAVLSAYDTDKALRYHLLGDAVDLLASRCSSDMNVRVLVVHSEVLTVDPSGLTPCLGP